MITHTRTARKAQPGFTLIELLVATGVLVLLAGILIPVLGRARQEAEVAPVISDLRQCVTALQIYDADAGGYPSLSQARDAVPWGVTCDPGDYWRRNCSEVWPRLLGSFGYAMPDGAWAGLYNNVLGRHDIVLFADIFHEDPRITPFRGDFPNITGITKHADNFHMPGFVLVGRSDGSAARSHVPDSGSAMMGWLALFGEFNLTDQA